MHMLWANRRCSVRWLGLTVIVLLTKSYKSIVSAKGCKIVTAEVGHPKLLQASLVPGES